MLNLLAEQQPLLVPVTGGPLGDAHHTSVIERGSFAVALCSCGWQGPARRARDRARRDADEHASG